MNSRAVSCGGVAALEDFLIQSLDHAIPDVAVQGAGAKISVALGNQRGSPDVAFDIVSPEWFAGFGVHTMKQASAIGNEDEPIRNRHGGEHVLLQGVGPNQTFARNVAIAGCIDAFE